MLKAYIVPILFPVLSVVDGVVIRIARSFARIRSADDIVFVRTDNLGDFVLWLAAASELRKQWPWPGRQFVLIANVNWAGLARSLQLFDDIIPINRAKFQRNLYYRIASLCAFARVRADLLVNPINSRDPISADTIARAVDANRKVAARGDASNAFGQDVRANRWYHEFIESTGVSVHEALRNRDFLAQFCGLRLADPWPRMCAPRMTKEHAGLQAEPYVVVAPGAGASRRAWPAERFASLAAKMAREVPARVVLVGTRSELPLINEVQHLSPMPVLNLAGKLTLPELLPVLKDAKFDSHKRERDGTSRRCLKGPNGLHHGWRTLW